MGRFKYGLEGQLSKKELGVLVKIWIGGAGLAGLIGWVDPVRTGQCGRIDS